MDRKRTSSVLVAAISLVAVSACSSDGDGGATVDSTTAAEVTTTAVPPATDAATTTVEVTTTVAPTPTEPAAKTTTTASTTTTPVTTVAATTTAAPTEEPASVPAIDAETGTIFGLRLFEETDTVVVLDTVTARLGAPTSDTDFAPTPPEIACYNSDRFRVVRWGDLRMTFIEVGDGAPESTQSLNAWSVGDETSEQLAPKDDPPATKTPTGITTAEGIGVGSTRDELQAAYPDADALSGFDDERVSLAVGGTDSGVLSYTFDGDTVIGIGDGPLDCAADPDEQR